MSEVNFAKHVARLDGDSSTLSLNDVRRAARRADRNKDGIVSKDEFRAYGRAHGLSWMEATMGAERLCPAGVSSLARSIYDSITDADLAPAGIRKR
jgi:hypothetical protein